MSTKAIKIGTTILAAIMLAGCSALPFEIVAKNNAGAGNALNPANGAERLFSPADHNFLQASLKSGHPVRRGARSERFELRDGDCGGSDCQNPRARAEIELTEGLAPSELGKGIWYGWSFYNQSVPAFDKANSLRLVFGQWTTGGKGQPAMRFIQLGAGEGEFENCDPAICDKANAGEGDLYVQLNDIAAHQGWKAAQNDGYVCRLLDLQQTKGRWVDMTVNTNFSTGSDGFLRIWVDGTLRCDYSGPLVSPETATAQRDIKHRRGIYSSWTKRWAKAEGGRPRPGLIVYYDEFRSGERKKDVDVAFLERVSDHPVD